VQARRSAGRFNLEDLLKGQRSRNASIDSAASRRGRWWCVDRLSLSNLLARFKPPPTQSTSSSRRCTIRADAGQHSAVLNWPYVEGLRIDEAMHPLTLMVVGLYGSCSPTRTAPLRLIVPGSTASRASSRSCRSASVRRQPNTAWNVAAPQEYGFYANVTRRLIIPAGVRPPTAHRRTVPRRTAADAAFNGYAAQVASLYQGMDLRRYF